MALRVLSEQGSVGIRQKIASITEDHDQWYLFTLDLTACADSEKTVGLIRAFEQNLETYEGVISYTQNSINALLMLGREQEIFQNLVMRHCPEGFKMEKVSSGLFDETIKNFNYAFKDTAPPPAAVQEEAPQEKRSPEFEKRMARQENHAMIIDDDAYIRTVFSATLKNNFKMTEMSNGIDIEQYYTNILPDIVFVDIHLPELDGFGILKRIMNIDPDAYVVVISGDSIQSNVIKAVKMGAKGFLTKPPKRSTLEGYLRKCPTVKLGEMAEV